MSDAEDAVDMTEDAQSIPETPAPHDDRKQLISQRDEIKRRLREAEAREAALAQRLSSYDGALESVRGAKTDAALAWVAKEQWPAARAVIAHSGIDLVTASQDEIVSALRNAGLVRTRSGGSPGAPGVNMTTKLPEEVPVTRDPKAERVADLARRMSDEANGRASPSVTWTPTPKPPRRTSEEARDLARRLSPSGGGIPPIQLGASPPPHRPLGDLRRVADIENEASRRRLNGEDS